MDSVTVLCIDDRPQVLELRKASLEGHGIASRSRRAATLQSNCWRKRWWPRYYSSSNRKVWTLRP
jgi:hypothetical protein